MATEKRPGDRRKSEQSRRSGERAAGNRRPASAGARPSEARGAGTKKVKKKKKNKVWLFILELVILAAMLVALYAVINVEKVEKINIDPENIVVNEEVEELESLKGYRNIALFGVDSRSGKLGKGTLTDTIMIASINEDTHEVRLVSIYRDTYLNLGNDSYNKANTAYSNGGPELAINMLNMNFDLNITDYVTVGFSGLIDTIDALGGVEIDVDSAELKHLNNYQIGTSEATGKKFSKVTSTGLQLLDGMQATSYCRIRYTAGDDFKRAERQREVVGEITKKAKKASLPTLTKIAADVFPQVSTSLSLEDITSLLGGVSEYSIVESTGFPFEGKVTTGTIGKKGSCVVPISLEENVVMLHELLFDEKDYVPSDNVKSYSDKIYSDTSSYVK